MDKPLYAMADPRQTTAWLLWLRARHPETCRHSIRVAKLAQRLAFSMKLAANEASELITGCLLHDIGKGWVSASILDQAEPLSSAQWERLKRHPELGAAALESCGQTSSGVIDIVRHHHERWDGRGYPYGLSGEDIPLLSRICAVVDSFDAMLSVRSYREQAGVEAAKRELLRCAGTQFDGRIVEHLLCLPERLLPARETQSAV